MSSKLKKAIGAVKDQTSISLAKVGSNNTSNLEVAVLKATTHDDVPMDERYVHEVVQLVSSSKIYAAACARAIGKRIGRTRNWIVVLKSLMLVLRNFQDGDPYFPREVLHAMKRGAKILNLSSFRDESNSSPWDYTAFVRTFALYLDERLDCFLTGKLQRRYTHRDTEGVSNRSRRPNEPVHDLKPAMLLDRISYWQRLLERAIATRPTGPAKTNRLVQTCLYAIVQESFDLYKDISDGLALLLDSFFHLQYQNCITAFQTCVKASKQFEELSGFYSLCKDVGVGRTSEYPSVQTISEELIETLQEFLKDQSSFPSITRSPNRSPLRITAQKSRRRNSYGNQSEFSVTTDTYSEMTSEFSSQGTSLEDLISATETGACPPAISIDLEAYCDQYDKQSQRDSTFKMSDSGSTRSLPTSNSMFDLLSVGDWPDDEDDKQSQKQQDQKCWDIVLAETMTEPSPNVPPTFNAFPEDNSFNDSTKSSKPSLTEANSFSFFSDNLTSTPSQNSFNGFEDAPTPSVQQGSSLRSNSFNAYPQGQGQGQGQNQGQGPIPPSESNNYLRRDSFNEFAEAQSPFVQQGSSLRSNSFNAYPQGQGQGPIPPSQSNNYLRTDSFNGFTEAQTPRNPLRTTSFAFPEATHQSPITLRVNSFNGFPEAQSPFVQQVSSLRSNSFNAFPDSLRSNSFTDSPSSSTQSRNPSGTTSFAFPEASNPSNNFNAFTESTNSPNTFRSNSFNAYPEYPSPSTQQSNNYNAFPESNIPQQNQQHYLCSYSAYPQNNNFNYFQDQEQEFTRTGWELALVESTTPKSSQSTTNMNNNFDLSSLESLYNQTSPQPENNHYNPFLQDDMDLTAVTTMATSSMTSSPPTFQATPTFSTQNPNNAMENDPFATGPGIGLSMSQQNLLHEQQLWLQNQNKIIAKHRV